MELIESPVPIILGLNKSSEYIKEVEIINKYPHYFYVFLDEGCVVVEN